MEEGFRTNALSYMLVLRLVPLLPFWLVNLVEGLGPRGIGPLDGTTVVVDGHEGPWVQCPYDGSALADRHVQVPMAGKHHGMAQFLKGQLGVEGHHEVQVPFGQSIRAHRARFGATMSGVEDHIDRVVTTGMDRRAAFVYDLATTSAADYR